MRLLAACSALKAERAEGTSFRLRQSIRPLPAAPNMQRGTGAVVTMMYESRPTDFPVEIASPSDSGKADSFAGLLEEDANGEALKK